MNIGQCQLDETSGRSFLWNCGIRSPLIRQRVGRISTKQVLKVGWEGGEKGPGLEELSGC